MDVRWQMPCKSFYEFYLQVDVTALSETVPVLEISVPTAEVSFEVPLNWLDKKVDDDD